MPNRGELSCWQLVPTTGRWLLHPTLPVGDALDTRIAVIQALNPLGLQAVAEVLQQEVAALAGAAPILEVTDAQTTLLAAEITLANAIFDQLAGSLQLRRALGRSVVDGAI